MTARVVVLRPALSRSDKSGILAECFGVLGGEFSPMATMWNGAGDKDRRLLLAMAGRKEARLCGELWSDLRPAVRADLVAGLGRFRRWAESLTA